MVEEALGVELWIEMFTLIHSTSIRLEVGDTVMNKAGSRSLFPECKGLIKIYHSGRGKKE